MARDIENTPAFKVGAIVLTVAVVALVIFTVVNLGQRETDARQERGTVVASSDTSSPSGAQLSTVFMGDSVTENSLANGLNTASQSQPWPIRVAVDPSSPWLQDDNAAVAGASTGQMLNVTLPSVLAAKPQAVVIMAGTVDAGRHTKVPKVQGHLKKIITQLQAAGAKVWVVSPPPNNIFNSGVANIVTAEKKIADELGVPFIDVFHAIGGAPGMWPDEDTVDGTLPNDAGQAAIADAVLAAVGTNASTTPSASATS